MASYNFDFTSHNRKIAKKRGESWKRKLREAKAISNPRLSAMAHARIQKNMTQADMMKPLKTNNNTIYSRIERGAMPTNRQRAELIAKTLDKNLSDLFIEFDKDKFIAI